MSENTTKQKDSLIRNLFNIGAHFGYSRSKRHPSVEPFVFGFKNNNAILDLEKAVKSLDQACDLVKTTISGGKKVLFVGNKNEVKAVVKKVADSVDMPYVAERWIGGTFTNFSEIRGRVNRLLEIKDQEVKGGLEKYTKKERGFIAKEKKDLERYFAGLVSMEKLPGLVVIIDPQAESIAVSESIKAHVPIVALCNSDCDISNIDCPIVANDSQVASVEFFISKLAEAVKEGKEIIKKEKND